MSWYEGKYSCGHEGRVNIIGPTKDRQRKADWHFSGMCPECYKKQLEEERAAANKEAAEKSAEMELPELNGTEKQVAWANVLRLDILQKCSKKISLFCKRNEERRSKGKDEIKHIDGMDDGELLGAVDFALKNHTEARFWIDERANDDTLKRFAKEYMKHKAEQNIPDDVKQELDEEKKALTVVPHTGERKSGVAEISFKDGVLSVSYTKDDKFREIVKSLGFKWSGYAWEKEITEFTGTAAERAAELGNKLLLSGFTVQFPDVESKEAAISGDVIPECKRWVKIQKNTGKLAITWKEKNDCLYLSAKKLPEAKWADGYMSVKVEFYREVQDFAETFGFSISKMAQGEIDKQKEKEAGFETAKISEHVEEIISDEKRLEKSLKSGGTILENLKDD